MWTRHLEEWILKESDPLKRQNVFGILMWLTGNIVKVRHKYPDLSMSTCLIIPEIHNFHNLESSVSLYSWLSLARTFCRKQPWWWAALLMRAVDLEPFIKQCNVTEQTSIEDHTTLLSPTKLTIKRGPRAGIIIFWFHYRRDLMFLCN